MIKLYIFDMGGVVVRNFQIATALFSYLGMDNTVSHFTDLPCTVQHAFDEHNCGTISENEFWQLFSKYTTIAIPQNEQSSLLGKFFHPEINEEVRSYIESLKKTGKRVVCGTNTVSSHYDIHSILGQYDFFDCIYASQLMGFVKPDAHFYSYILEKEHVLPEEVFFTDDSYENVCAARDLGINAFVFESIEKLKNDITHIP